MSSDKPRKSQSILARNGGRDGSPKSSRTATIWKSEPAPPEQARIRPNAHCQDHEREWGTHIGFSGIDIVGSAGEWHVRHNGSSNTYATKEAAFEAAVAAGSLALRQGHGVRLTVPGQRHRRDKSALKILATTCPWQLGTEPAAQVLFSIQTDGGNDEEDSLGDRGCRAG